MSGSSNGSARGRHLRHVAGLALASALLLPCCTTFMRAIDCGGRPWACAELHDVRFCENVVVTAEGADCAGAGLSAGKPFCYVSTARCVHTTYALKDHDCVVREYTPVREWSECSTGTPTFGP
jgi:hypothetical protein